ncbi:MAG: putative DNA binding domain-containing protein [Erysipelotrichaceae bacterium]
MEKEGLNIEYKSEYTETIKKSIIAFANTLGGKIFIGINDDLTIQGVGNTDEVQLQITNMIRDFIKPDISMFVNLMVEKKDDKNILIIEIQRGTACPYYVASKGIRPEGVFIRQGASSVPATETAILKMIKETSGDNYEEIRSLYQDLSFNSSKTEFDFMELKFGIEQMRTLGLLGSDGLYTNLALLLSDQCIHTIKVAVFQGTTKEVFKDRFEFTGSLFKQLRDCFSFIDRYNSTRSEIEGLTRIDYRDYPQIAIREALLNAIVHRDYSFSASTLISIFDNRMEMVSIGGLMRGVSMEDMLLGVSILRNKALANIFYRLKMIEAYGTGVIKIIESYDDSKGQKPIIETTDNAFKITLFNTHSSSTNLYTEKIETENELALIEVFKEKKTLKRKEVQVILNISQSMSIKLLKSLADANVIQKIGQGKNTTYLYKK